MFDVKVVHTRRSGYVRVGIDPEKVESPDYKHVTPSIAIEVEGHDRVLHLTWMEAKQLALAINWVTDVSECG
jgi:hypothetical protein